MKLWGGRFESGPSEVFERFSGSLHFDRRLIDADIRGSQAFARALRTRRHPDGGRARDASSRRSSRSARKRATPAFFDGATDEDVHTLVIRKLKERVGALADKIHTGRSRNEQVSLDVRLWLREEMRPRRASCSSALHGVAARAGASAIRDAIDSRLHAHAPRAGGAVAALPAGVFRNVRARLRSASAKRARRVNVMPLGSGALAGSGFPFDREAIARDLGFDAHHAQQHGCFGRPRFRARLSATPRP